MRIGLVVGEASGDILGAGLIKAIRARIPDATFEGVAGPRMAALGCRVLHSSERLSVMGLVEVLGRYPELYAMRADLVRHFTANPPDVFVGIDAPEFNLGLEARLKAANVLTAHYVSPQVWAWRRGRLRTISQSVDLMLTLFPFEAAFYEEHGVPVRFVGHPLADAIPGEKASESDRSAARAALSLAAEGDIIALLPGSRQSEVSRLAEVFVRTARWCLQRRPGLRFIVPLVNAATRRLFENALVIDPDLPLMLFDGRSREVMAAADAVLVASGTATLEAMLLDRPMVVAYRMAPMTYWLAKRLVYIDRYAIPNLLAGESLVPEFIQGAARPENMGAALLAYLEDPQRAAATHARFAELHTMLRQGADERAADAVLELAARGRLQSSAQK
ncbi:MAG: lipid-A-disaccharide synthase [Chromatiales bacterium]|nr:lipid-A-disaccharide synthase [Chromatiales bacterium]